LILVYNAKLPYFVHKNTAQHRTRACELLRIPVLETV
jgi:hypothetical protein